MSRRLVVSACSALIASFYVNGCAADDGTDAATPAQTVTVTATPSDSGPAPVLPGASESAPPVTAEELAEALAQQLTRVETVTTLTSRTDPNGLLGRPGGYRSAAVLTDRDGDQTDPEPGVAYGVTVEVFANARQAIRRKDYIRRVLRDAPMLGTEYGFVFGNTLLRVSGELPPAVAYQYRDALRGLLPAS